MSDVVVSLRRVTKAYRHFTLDRIDLEARAGRVLGLVGTNGAGKSTLFRIIMGLVRADSGRVHVLGRSMPRDQVAIKRSIGFVSEDMRLQPSRTLRWHGALVRDFCPSWDEPRARDLAGRFELKLEQKAGELSRGQTMKALLMFALARRPRILLLDEPTAGLDPPTRREVLDELTRVARAEGMSVVFSTHLTEDLERIADEVAVLERGRLVSVRRAEPLNPWRCSNEEARYAT